MVQPKLKPSENLMNSSWKKNFSLGQNGLMVTLSSFLGWTMVNMDNSFFSSVYPLIQKDLHLSDGMISSIITVMAIAGCLATLISGPLADYIGRKVIFQWTIAFTAIGSALSAVSGGFIVLLIARCMTMAGNASEWMIGQVMVTEGTPKESRGWWTGVAQVGWPVGYFLTSIIVTIFVPAWGWRGVFWVGLLPVALILLSRIWVKESDRFVEVKKERENKRKHAPNEKISQFTYRQLLNSDLRNRTLLLWLWQFIYNYGLYAVAFFLPSIAAAHGFKLSDTWVINAWGTAIGALGFLLAAFLGNIYGRKQIAQIWLLLGGIAGTCFAFFTNTPHQMAFWWSAYYFFTVGHMGVYIPYMMESFPTRTRATGSSLMSFANWGALLLAGITSELMVKTIGVEISTFIWLGIASWIAFICSLGTPKIAPGQELEDIIV
ncbi:MFS transporter [Bacillus sp. MUM 13]|uniref:MFS transporter n=1 Tax=Bacillus sp. MUM 13 TaxID=1678001 RepID=UPI0008F57740|nr:MFS transporter [Bacillus sp. MUM 13]OIK11934.1 hypothetical protein BIV59_10445 [Bacillus sp. MUM 13]